MEVRELAKLPMPEAHEGEDLRRRFQRLRSLQDVIQFGLAQRPPAIVADIVTQDEYTHDVILPYQGRFLVFDTT